MGEGTEEGKSKKPMGWLAKMAITVVGIATPIMGNAMMEWKTDMDNRMEDMEKSQPAAFHVIYENEQSNLRQWQQLSLQGKQVYSTRSSS